jgi:hypothetical protein
VAAAVVLSIVAVAILLSLKDARGKGGGYADQCASGPYAGSLALTGLAMSESANLAGGKVTYLDGHIANTGARTVTAVTVQVLFRDLRPRSGAERDPHAAQADPRARTVY